MIQRAKPVAEQVYEALVSRLEAGRYAPDERMPSETRFAAEFEVSRATIRDALGKLEARGLIVRRQGDGTYATPWAFDIRLLPHEEWQIVRQIEASDRRAAIQVLEAKRGPATPREASALAVDVSAEVWHFRYRFWADDVPIMVASYTIPAIILTPFDPTKDLNQPLARFLSRFSVLAIAYGEAQFNGVPASPAIAQNLQLDPAVPILEISSMLYGQNDRPIVHVREYYRQGEGLQIRVLDR